MLRRRSPGHLYMAHLREFLTTHKMVFKVGRSADNNICNRTRSYPKGSAIHMIVSVGDVFEAEATMLRILRQLPALIARTDIGSEYFEGDPHIIAAVVASMHTAFRPQFTPDEVIEAPAEADEPSDVSGGSDDDVQMVDAGAITDVVADAPTQPPNTDADALFVSYVEANRSTLSGATVRATDLLKSIVAFGVERSFTGRIDLAGVQRRARALFEAKLTPAPFQDGVAPAVLFPSLLPPEPEAPVVQGPAESLREFLAMEDADRGYRISKVEGCVTLKNKLQEAFADRMENARFDADATALHAFGYRLGDANGDHVCKTCMQLAKVRGGKCCEAYSITNRSKRVVVHDMQLVKLTQ